MPDAIDNNYKLYPVVQSARSLSISLKSLFELALSESCAFLVHLPDNIEIYLNRELISPDKNFMGRVAGQRHIPKSLIHVDQKIELLGLDPTKCLPLFHYEKLLKKEFEFVGLLNEAGNVMRFDPISYKRQYPEKHLGLYITGSFLTYESAEAGLDWYGKRSQPTIQKSIEILIGDLLISAEDLAKIDVKLRASQPDYGEFEQHVWTTPMLMDLNQASKLFSSGERDPDEEEIRNWFRKKWEFKEKSPGKALIEQAAKAVLPDHFYSSSTLRSKSVSADVREKYNDYYSTALIIINETAKYFHEKLENKEIKKFPTQDDIIEYLKKKGMNVRLARCASTIMRDGR